MLYCVYYVILYSLARRAADPPPRSVPRGNNMNNNYNNTNTNDNNNNNTNRLFVYL